MSFFLLPPIFCLNNDHFEGEYTPPPLLPEPVIINSSLFSFLNNLKTQIDSCPNEWDKYKKYTNPHEYIHSIIPNTKQSVSCLKPLSRSFFKMIEICKMLDILSGLPPTGCTTFHLAEGPGGFIEALVHMRSESMRSESITMRSESMRSDDKYYGMTLLDDTDLNVPGWRKSRQFLHENPNVCIDYGKDGTGDLMQADNLKDCFYRFKGTMDLITGDGGFDFSLDFNQQENTSTKLVFCQIAFALAMQRPKGHFILKIFDTFTKISLDLLYLLANSYDQVYFVKPSTSRPANSEKYVVCKGFHLSPLQTEELVRKCYSMLANFQLNPTFQLKSLFNFNLPLLFNLKIEEYNAMLGQQQIENIAATLSLILNNTAERLETMKKNNIQKCIIWCQKYNIPYHTLIVNNNIFKRFALPAAQPSIINLSTTQVMNK